MGFDDVFQHLGDFGRYQKRIYILVSLPAISCTFHKLITVFLLARPLSRCLLPFEDAANATYALSAAVRNMSLPHVTFSGGGGGGGWSSCSYLDANYTDAEYWRSGVPSTAQRSCDGYVYDRSRYVSSTVMDWDMVCDRKWMRATTDSLFMVGVLLGSIGFGYVSDRVGRKPVFFAALVLQLVFGIAAGVAPEYWTYTLARLIVGAATSGVFLVAYVMAMEMVGPSMRLFAGVVNQMFCSLGFMLIAVFAYYIHDWRQLQVAITLPGVLFMSYYWCVPESSRWLLSKGRHREAIRILRRAAAVNGVTIPPAVLDELVDESKATIEVKRCASTQHEASVFDLLRFPNLRRRTLVIFCVWIVNNVTYYGLSWNTSNLGGNDLLNFVISGAVEIPAYVFLLLTLNRWGRRMILCGCMLLAGAALSTTLVVPVGWDWLVVGLAMLGKMAITASYGAVYIFTTELFPTPVRNVGLGAASMMARFGGIAVPYVNMLAEVWKPLPLLILGVLSLVVGMLSLMLPETLNRELPETIDEGERFGVFERVGRSVGVKKHKEQETC